jgi:hypothetical protein
MQKLLKRRPSAGVIIGFLALCVALGGGAYAATKKKIEYKGLSKDARLKVLPVSGTNAGENCNPNSQSTFTVCTSISIQSSTAFPRRVMLVFDGTFDAGGSPTPPATGECRLQLDGQPLNGTTDKIQVNTTNNGGHGEPGGINIVTTPQGGKHTYSVACNETAGDLKVQQFQLSGITVR